VTVAFAGLLVACHPKGSATGAGDAAVAAGSRTDGGEGGAKASPEAAAPIADDALPAFTSEELVRRARHLLEAIQKDDGELAGDIVFPRDAYIAVKDVADPGKHWDQKVLAAFRKDVHVLHKRMKGIDRARFTGFELGQPASEAMPKKHDLLRMLWRAKRSRLAFTIDGKPSHFDVAEMTSWKGAWYVTRLR